MHNKLCKKCQVVKPLSDYHRAKNKQSGYQAYCKRCSIEINKNRYKLDPSIVKHRTQEREKKIYDLLNEIKQYYGCYFCPENCWCCLDFHHIDSDEKEYNISNLVSRHNVPLIVQEIKKCILVCTNCHRKIHQKIITYSAISIAYDRFEELLQFSRNKHASVV